MVAVISGGSRGIGKGIAKEFATKGIDIAFCYCDDKICAEQTVIELRALGIKAQGYICDISDYMQCETFIMNVLKDFGQIDILINNAGIVDDAPLVLMTEKQFERVMDVNMKGVYHLTKLCMPYIKRQDSGRVINISSISGLIGIEGQANYSASKAAVIGFTKAVAKEYGRYGVTCNVIAPGFIDTDMPKDLTEKRKEEIINSTLLKRIGSVEDIAGIACFLASNKASYITGEVIRVDGGLAIN